MNCIFPRSSITSGGAGVQIQAIWLQVYSLNHFIIIKNWLNLLDYKAQALNSTGTSEVKGSLPVRDPKWIPFILYMRNLRSERLICPGFFSKVLVELSAVFSSVRVTSSEVDNNLYISGAYVSRLKQLETLGWEESSKRC